MRIKLDENLPACLAHELVQMGHDADTVVQEGLAGCNDVTLWQAAQDAGRFQVTQDLDFSDIRRYEPGQHAGLLLIRLREPGRATLLARVAALFDREDVTAWEGCFVVLTDHKIRVRHPKTS